MFCQAELDDTLRDYIGAATPVSAIGAQSVAPSSSN
eukprot:COSAG01_NODE_71268_length_256_cov_0.955414_1_plen_35_part_01